MSCVGISLSTCSSAVVKPVVAFAVKKGLQCGLQSNHSLPHAGGSLSCRVSVHVYSRVCNVGSDGGEVLATSPPHLQLAAQNVVRPRLPFPKGMA